MYSFRKPKYRAAFRAAFGAGAAGAGAWVFIHKSGKFALTIACILAQDPKGLFATMNLIGASSAALYSTGDIMLPFSAKYSANCKLQLYVVP